MLAENKGEHILPEDPVKFSIDIEADVFKQVLEEYNQCHKVKAIMEDHGGHIKVYFDIPEWYPGNVRDIHATALIRLGYYLGKEKKVEH